MRRVAAWVSCVGLVACPKVTPVESAGRVDPAEPSRGSEAEARPAVPVPTPDPSADPILPWPPPPLSDAMVAEVVACHVEDTAKARYAEGLGLAELAGAFAPSTPCDQAVLAHACGLRLGDDGVLPDACLAAYRGAVAANAAYAFAGALPYAYYGQLAIGASPPSSSTGVRRLEVHYTWGGLGDAVDWTLVIDDADTAPRVTARGASAVAPPDLAARVQAVGGGVGNFVGVRGPVAAVDCYDNYPDWTATITFADGATFAYATHGSNLIGAGGPWQVTVGDATALQLAPGLARSVATLAYSLGLPFGSPAAMYCPGYDLGGHVLGTTP